LERQTIQGQGVPADKPACRVFLVEDDADDMFFSKKQLEESGFVNEVKCFSDGTELIDYMKAQGFYDRSVVCLEPIIIVIDLNMPRRDGFRLLQILKSDKFLQGIPMLVVSSILDYDVMRKAMELQADGVFRKPLNAEKIREYVDQAWQWPTREMWIS
jgi:CheY-like chemotaxis protein